jgi:ABC-type polysaccharide/polyol phosphate export permease
MLLDFLVSIPPLIGGTALLVTEGWNWLIALLLALLLVLAFVVTGLARGAFACKYCKQREVGCSAYEMFGGNADG